MGPCLGSRVWEASPPPPPAEETGALCPSTPAPVWTAVQLVPAGLRGSGGWGLSARAAALEAALGASCVTPAGEDVPAWAGLVSPVPPCAVPSPRAPGAVGAPPRRWASAPSRR